MACALLISQPMSKIQDAPDPFRHDPATLRMLADEADGHRYTTAFGHLDERTLLRAMAAALRAYAQTQEGRERAQRVESGDEQASAA